MGKTFNMVGGASGGGGGIELSSIAITTPPTKTAYQAGETFNPAGMVVTATYTNGATLAVGGYTYPQTPLSYGTTSVTITYTEGGISKTATQAITVSKITPTISISPSSITLDTDHLTATATITTDSGGALSVSSSDTSVATASLSGTTITVNSVSSTNGTATITVSQAASGDYDEGIATLSVTASFIDPVLNNNSWATISRIARAGEGANYWSIGDTKTVSLSGTVGTLAVSGSYDVFIIGFNHRGVNGITFQGFKTSGGTNISLCDSYCGSYESYDGTKYFQHNHWGPSQYGHNYGGWKGSELRYDILGSTNSAPSGYGSANSNTGRVGYDASATTPTNPVSNTLMAALPSALRNVLQPMTVYTDNVGNDGNVSSNISASVDYLPLLAEYEVNGARTYANQYEQNYQEQYAYYKNGNSKIKYKHTATSTAASWLTRSTAASYDTTYCVVNSSGRSAGGAASSSHGLAPAFML